MVARLRWAGAHNDERDRWSRPTRAPHYALDRDELINWNTGYIRGEAGFLP